MIYTERPAPPGLESFVSRLWYQEVPPLRRHEKILPMPFVHAIVNLSAPYRLYDRNGTPSQVGHAFVSGIQTEYLVIENPPLIRHVGVELRAHGLRALSSVPADSVTGRVTDAEDVLPGFGDIMTGVPATPEAALDAITAYLVASHRPGTADPLVERVLAEIHTDPQPRIGDVARACGVTHKTLIARFTAACGITPKAYAEVWRFHRFVSELRIGEPLPTWAELAAASPYYDQPEVIRTFRRFSGYTPAEYLRRVSEFGPDAASFVPLDEVPTG